MRVSAWLTLDIKKGSRNWKDDREVKITGVRQSRPENQMAVHVTLEIDPDDMQPHVEALVQTGHIILDLTPPEEEGE